MDILYLLIPLSVMLVILIGAVFWYALRGGQYDDLDGPALKILLDDDSPGRPAPCAGAARGSAGPGGLDPGQIGVPPRS
jgi:cbb3-type cytochrome oxidase maturation protein